MFDVRLINFDLTHWFATRSEQFAYAARCGFEHQLVSKE